MGLLGILLFERATNDYWLPALATAVPITLALGVVLSVGAIYWRSRDMPEPRLGPVALAWFGALVASVAMLSALPGWHTFVSDHRFILKNGYVWTWQQTFHYYSTTWGATLPTWWLGMAAIAVVLMALAIALAWGLGGRHRSTNLKEAT
ncbi:MAG: hypothetical protein ACYCZN_13135 [Candidatus Dormibacteria bacterium]